jgi:hypothetical protein
MLGGAAAAAIQEGVGAYPAVKLTQLTEAVADAKAKLAMAEKGGNPKAVEAAKAAYDAALGAAGGK